MNIIGIAGRREDGSSAGAGKDEVAKILAAQYGYVVVSFADEIKRTAMRWYGFTPEQCWGSEKESPDLRYPREHGPWQTIQDEDEGAVVCECCGWRTTLDYRLEPVTGRPRYCPPFEGQPQCYLTPRFVFRFLGTEAGRMFYGDTWVALTLSIADGILLEGRMYDQRYGLGAQVVNNGYKAVVIPDMRWPDGNEGQAIKKAGGRLWLVERAGTAQVGTAMAKHASETQPIPASVFDAVLRNNGTLVELQALVAWALLKGG